MSEAQEAAVVSARQVGKSFACACWLILGAWLNPGTRNWWTAPTYSQAEIGYNYFTRLGRARPDLGQPSIIKHRLDSRLRLELINGSIIECRSWEREENLQGPPLDRVVDDEAGLLTPEAHAIISSGRSHTLGPIRYIGNPGPVGATFWKICQHAAAEQDAGNPRYAFLKWTWLDKLATLRGPEARDYQRFIDEERASLPEYEFRRLYEADWTVPEQSVFAGIMEQLFRNEPRTAPHAGHRYFIGWDIGVERDFTVGWPMCIDCFAVTHLERLRPGDSTVLAPYITQVCKHWNDGVAVIETNGPGKPIFDQVQRLYKRVQPWFTDVNNKRAAVFEIIRRARMGQLSFPRVGVAMDEFRAYLSKQSARTGLWSFEAPSGGHDDCVSAALVAVGAATGSVSAYLEMLSQEVAERRAAQPTPEPRPPIRARVSV